MPLTDSYGQEVPYPTLTDKPNAQTLGQGIVEGLTPKVVMRFASAVVRGGKILKPAAGMVTWLEDVGRLEVYDGSAWVPFGYGSNQWKNVTLASGWTHGNDRLSNFQYRVVNMFGEANLMFRGGVSRTSYPATMPDAFVLNATQLPVEARPTYQRTVIVPCSAVGSNRSTLSFDVRPDGYLQVYPFDSATKPSWVGFDGLSVSL